MKNRCILPDVFRDVLDIKVNGKSMLRIARDLLLRFAPESQGSWHVKFYFENMKSTLLLVVIRVATFVTLYVGGSRLLRGEISDGCVESSPTPAALQFFRFLDQTESGERRDITKNAFKIMKSEFPDNEYENIQVRSENLFHELMERENRLSTDASVKEVRRTIVPVNCAGCYLLENYPVKFRVCGKCKRIRYCSRDCQRRDWKGGHKKICVAK